MPKSTKKKKDKAADFSKAKLKLGKGKQLANNAVDTSFKARSIALPSQSIAQGSSNAPTTKRRLTFENLISYLKHYNVSTRKDAIFGLRELLEENPHLLADHLTALVNGTVRVIGDEDASVRKALLGFFGWLLPRVPQSDLHPHAPILLLFTTSALTHIFPEIRIDAIRFLDIFLEHIPEIVIEGWARDNSGHGRRVLQGYLGVLSAGTAYGHDGDSGPVKATSTASVILSPGSKLVVLKSLATFLNRALAVKKQASQSSSSSSSTPTRFFASSFSSQSAFETFDSLLRPTLTDPTKTATRQWAEETDPTEDDFVGAFTLASSHIGDSWSLQDLTNVELPILGKDVDGGQSSTGVNAEYTHVLHLTKMLHATLVSTLLDCAPAVFSPSSSPPETELNMILTISDIARSLYGALLQDASTNVTPSYQVIEDLSSFLGHMSPYFPFVPSGSILAKRDIKIEQAFQDLNITYCELTSLLLLVSPTPEHVSTSRSSNGKRPASTPTHLTSLQVDRVHDYVVRLLRGEPPSGSVQATLPRPIAPSVYSALLPTIWALINHAALERSQDSESLLVAVIEHAIKVSSTSAVKIHTLDFLGRLILLNTTPEYRGPIRIEWDSEEGHKLSEWLLHLPKTVWELGSNNQASTEVIFRLLLRLRQRKFSLLCNEQTLGAIRSRLAPYFVINHPSRGKLPGPFAKLPPSPLRRLALDVGASLCPTSDGDAADLIAAIHEAVRDAGEGDYWVSVMRD
ncbi:unnamed protein product [Somion occarium]|uniref:Pre-rRNA-processing protein n=1 Tax=Somion occarium TaxID=3059160 RepID=A0ABP1CIB2_9APHY